jgi:hypothetical protein
MAHSDILWGQYKQARAQHDAQPGGASRNISTIVRKSIENQATRDVMDMCRQGAAMEQRFENGSEEFYSLLGTDNCKGAVWMLKDYAGELGFQTISHIDVIGNSGAIAIHFGAFAG